MPTIKIDNVDYDTDTLSAEAKAQLASIQFCDQELARLQAKPLRTKPPGGPMPKPCKRSCHPRWSRLR